MYVGQNGGKKINIEMQNTYQEDWAERSLFYNCRMFTEGLKTGQSYSSKFQFHVIELSKIATTKGKARKQDLYKWAKLISASTREEIREESEGNHYMEKAGIVGAAQGSKPREVLIQDENSLENLLSALRK